ncbi:hypothetical protein CAEBREN_03650 [Caenorhabditis brenneri]|uniref:Uncharacterized protein n=1 Tax=Caenorhabditis brenneri TaxID=135651 RepID=G0MTG3_CAEBE|nr:hypothetical protein CAEBREN_03650 [Caenorhabditis brenneri]
MVAWRAAGLNYVRFSQIAAEITRKCTKAAPGKAAAKKPEATLKINVWENGKQQK